MIAQQASSNNQRNTKKGLFQIATKETYINYPPTHKHPLDVSCGNLSMDAAPNTVRENLQSRDPSIEVYVP